MDVSPIRPGADEVDLYLSLLLELLLLVVVVVVSVLLFISTIITNNRVRCNSRNTLSSVTIGKENLSLYNGELFSTTGFVKRSGLPGYI